jgi:phosphatidate cytidylyltransferase
MKYTLNKYSNLTQRIVAALVGVSIILTCIYYSPWTYFAVFFFICMFTLREFYKLVGLDGMVPLKTFGTLCGLTLFTLIFLVESSILHPQFYFLLFPLAFGIFLIKLYKKSDRKPFTNIAITFLGIIYVALPFGLLHVASFSQGSYHFEIIIGTLFILWASDTGAYFAGVRFGKRKLFERVSPKKSWEGSVGGAVLAFAFCWIMAESFPLLPFWKWAVVTMIIIVTGTYGDLIESLFKRSIEIKDSGTSIPGHGGFMDRFDSLLVASPFITAFLKMTAA